MKNNDYSVILSTKDLMFAHIYAKSKPVAFKKYFDKITLNNIVFTLYSQPNFFEALNKYQTKTAIIIKDSPEKLNPELKLIAMATSRAIAKYHRELNPAENLPKLSINDINKAYDYAVGQSQDNSIYSKVTPYYVADLIHYNYENKLVIQEILSNLPEISTNSKNKINILSNKLNIGIKVYEEEIKLPSVASMTYTNPNYWQNFITTTKPPLHSKESFHNK